MERSESDPERSGAEVFLQQESREQQIEVDREHGAESGRVQRRGQQDLDRIKYDTAGLSNGASAEGRRRHGVIAVSQDDA